LTRPEWIGLEVPVLDRQLDGVVQDGALAGRGSGAGGCAIQLAAEGYQRARATTGFSRSASRRKCPASQSIAAAAFSVVGGPRVRLRVVLKT
jgi:hypothetical protein